MGKENHSEKHSAPIELGGAFVAFLGIASGNIPYIALGLAGMLYGGRRV